MDKTKTIENMAKFYYEIYCVAINDPTVPKELQMELDMGAVDFVLDSDLDSWVRTVSFIDNMNIQVVALAQASKSQPAIYESCRILNRKLTMIIDGMKKVLQLDMHISGWMRNNGKLEAIL